jgi:hypothetical protein
MIAEDWLPIGELLQYDLQKRFMYLGNSSPLENKIVFFYLSTPYLMLNVKCLKGISYIPVSSLSIHTEYQKACGYELVASATPGACLMMSREMPWLHFTMRCRTSC